MTRKNISKDDEKIDVDMTTSNGDVQVDNKDVIADKNEIATENGDAENVSQQENAEVAENVENKTNQKTKLSKKKTAILYVVLIVSILISSTTGILAKFAAGEPFLSLKFCLLYGGEILILFIYALIWQQVIKHLNLSVAYSFKATALIWTLVWGFFIFKEHFGITNFIGVAVVIVGIIIVNLKK